MVELVWGGTLINKSSSCPHLSDQPQQTWDEKSFGVAFPESKFAHNANETSSSMRTIPCGDDDTQNDTGRHNAFISHHCTRMSSYISNSTIV